MYLNVQFPNNLSDDLKSNVVYLQYQKLLVLDGYSVRLSFGVCISKYISDNFAYGLMYDADTLTICFNVD